MSRKLSWRFLIDPEEAAKTPRKAAIAVFALLAPSLALLAYYVFGIPNEIVAAIVGALGALGVSLMTYQRAVSEAGLPKRRPRLRAYAFDFSLVALGLGLLVAGAVARSGSLAVGGLPFLALGLVLAFARRWRTS